jgi:hypothetical protein
MELPTAQAVVRRLADRRRRSRGRAASEHRPTRRARRKRGRYASSPRRRSRTGWAGHGRRGAGLFESLTAWPLVRHQWPRSGPAAGRHRRTVGGVGNAGKRAPGDVPLQRNSETGWTTGSRCDAGLLTQPTTRRVGCGPTAATPRVVSRRGRTPGRAGADGRIRSSRADPELVSERGPALFLRRRVDLAPGKRPPASAAGKRSLASGPLGRCLIASAFSGLPAAGVSRPRSAPTSSPGTRSGEKSALTHFLEWITTRAWTWNNCDRMYARAA